MELYETMENFCGVETNFRVKSKAWRASYRQASVKELERKKGKKYNVNNIEQGIWQNNQEYSPSVARGAGDVEATTRQTTQVELNHEKPNLHTTTSAAKDLITQQSNAYISRKGKSTNSSKKPPWLTSQ